MRFICTETVCDCGCKEIVQGHEIQNTEGNWTTLAERKANPAIKIASAQQLVWIGDTTWYYCSSCNKELDPTLAKQKITEMLGGKSLGELPWKEEIGIGIINPRGLKKLKLLK